MKIFRTLDEITDIEPTVVAMGNFDGVHLGHQELIRRMKNSAVSAGMKSAVFTFSNHPRTMIEPENPVKSIIYAEDKLKIFEETGIDYLFDIPFTEEICSMEAEDYVEKLLLEKFRMREAYCGFNYRFGHKAAGNTELLMKLSLERGFGIHVMEPYKVDGETVSSTKIRSMIEEGDVERARRFLGRNYGIAGEVVVGNRLGKSLGFPTSNLIIDKEMVTPSNGVYVTYCTYDGVRYPGITNVGVKPTIGEFKKNVETHIFNFDKELYGKQIRVEFLKKMRPEIKFPSVEELSHQITNDCIKAKAYHRSISRDD